MASWSEFHGDPRKSYYLFLRQGYGRPAHAAHTAVKRIDNMVLELQGDRCAPAVSKHAMAAHLLGLLTEIRMSLTCLWTSLRETGTPQSAKAKNRMPSRFSQAS